MKRAGRWMAVAAAAVAALGGPTAASGHERSRGPSGAAPDGRDFVVVYSRGADPADGRAAVRATGGRLIRENRAIGVATVRSARRGFARRLARSRAIAGAARDRAIGRAPRRRDPARMHRSAPRGPRASAAAAGEPLAGHQWDMAMIGATPAGSYARQTGSHAVKVAIVDSGVQGDHPDIAPNFDAALSRNFVTDIPSVDGPCEVPSCVDPPDIDDDGHGTHIAGIVGAALNGVGIGGVAPGVALVNLRAGQDSGYFFVQPTVDALTFAGDHGIDVANLSFFVDPWLYNCPSDPGQAAIVTAVQRALDYARARGVTLVAASGNEATDLGRPTVDEASPTYPSGSARRRTIDNACLNLPTEGEGVLAVNALGPSGRKAYYSNYGVEQTTVAAPGGDDADAGGVPDNLILAPYPSAAVGQRSDADGDDRPDIDAAGNPTLPTILRDGNAYWQWLEGTSMATPHAAGVAALIVAQHGRADAAHGGLTLDPDEVERILRASARDTPCPEPRVLRYPGLPAGYDAVCEGGAAFNGFYGDGIVDGAAAVRSPPVPPGTPPADPAPVAPASRQAPPAAAPPRRASGRLTAKLRARRRGRRVVLRVSGRLTGACTAGGRVAVRVQGARRRTVARRTARLRRDCSYARTIALSWRRRQGRVLRVRVAFRGTSTLARVQVPRRVSSRG